MEEDVCMAHRERRKKSIRFREERLEAQSRATAEEGTSRFDPYGLKDVPLNLLLSKRAEGTL